MSAWLWGPHGGALCRLGLSGWLAAAECDLMCWMLLAWPLFCLVWVGWLAWHGGRVSVGLPSLGACALVWWCPVPSGGSFCFEVWRAHAGWGRAGPLGFACSPLVGLRPSSCPRVVPGPRCCGPFPLPLLVLVPLCLCGGSFSGGQSTSSPGGWVAVVLILAVRQSWCLHSGVHPLHPVRGLVVGGCDSVCWMRHVSCLVWVAPRARHGGCVSLELLFLGVFALV